MDNFLQRMRKRKRNDIAWQYCTVVDNNVGRVRCNFCGQVMWGGVTRLKQHLACIKGNVIPCRCCPPEVMAQIQEYLGHGSQKNEENIYGGSEQVNYMRGGGNEEQLQQEQEGHKLMGEFQEYLPDGTQKDEENIDGVREQVNEIRGGRNEEQLQPEQEHWQKFTGEIEEYIPHCSEKNEANIDCVSEQVNDMRGEGNEEQLPLKQEWWQKSVGDDMFAYLCEATFDYGWQTRNQEYEMGLKPKNDEYERAVEAAQRESKLTFWEDGTRCGEGCSGTKPVPSYQEDGMNCNDSDENSEPGF